MNKSLALFTADRLRHLYRSVILMFVSRCRWLGSAYDSILVRVLIVVICLIIAASVLVITAGFSQNEAQPNEETPNNRNNERRWIINSEEPCTLRGKEIACSHIPQNTGELVALYINRHSDDVSKVYDAHCYLLL
jgi:hypothetical protein